MLLTAVRISTEADEKDPLVGFVVPKRAIARAVYRNLVKRRLRESVRSHWDELPEGAQIVLTAKAAAEKSSYADLDAAFISTLERALAKGRK